MIPVPGFPGALIHLVLWGAFDKFWFCLYRIPSAEIHPRILFPDFCKRWSWLLFGWILAGNQFVHAKLAWTDYDASWCIAKCCGSSVYDCLCRLATGNDLRLTLPQQKLSHLAHRRASCFVVRLFSCFFCAATAWDARAENEAFRHQSISIGWSLSQQLQWEFFGGLSMSRQISRWKATVAFMHCWFLLGAIWAHQLAGHRTGRSSEPWRILPLRWA